MFLTVVSYWLESFLVREQGTIKAFTGAEDLLNAPEWMGSERLSQSSQDISSQSLSQSSQTSEPPTLLAAPSSDTAAKPVRLHACGDTLLSLLNFFTVALEKLERPADALKLFAGKKAGDNPLEPWCAIISMCITNPRRMGFVDATQQKKLRLVISSFTKSLCDHSHIAATATSSLKWAIKSVYSFKGETFGIDFMMHK
jgi:hypothetical protein